MTSAATLVPVLEARLTASDAAPQSYLGASVALEGDTALLGAPGVGGNAGAVYVFGREGASWSQLQRLVASDGHAFANFGQTVALQGDTALVGAPEYMVSSAVYVFMRIGGYWSEQQRLVASDPGPDDQLGSALALSGDTAFIGAPSAGSNAGAVYVFSRVANAWTQTSKLTVAGSTSFGISVAVSADNLVIGDAYTSYAFAPSGGAWVQKALLWPASAGQQGAPGLEVAVSGDTAVVVSGHSHPAHVFENLGGSWTEAGSLELSTGAYITPFNSVSLSGDTCALGSYEQDQTGSVGTAHVFTRAGGKWSLAADIAPPAGAEHDGFANNLALSGTSLLANAAWGQGQAGVAYVYTLQEQTPAPEPQRVHVDSSCAYGGTPHGALGALCVAVAAVVLVVARRATRSRWSMR